MYININIENPVSFKESHGHEGMKEGRKEGRKGRFISCVCPPNIFGT
jgi:hypothetical protein